MTNEQIIALAKLDSVAGIEPQQRHVLYLKHYAQMRAGKKVWRDFTQEEMEWAFSLVQNQEHWKGAINAIVNDLPPRCLEAIDAAVPYFTGGSAVISPAGLNAEGRPTHRVRAAGYWVSIGA